MITVWAVRFLHVLGAALWVGGFAFLALGWHDLSSAGRATVLRALRWAGTLTLLAGLALVRVTRGFGAFGHGEWGGIVATGLLVACMMLGVSKVPGVPRRWIVVAGVLGVLAVAMMTRAPYAR